MVSSSSSKFGRGFFINISHLVTKFSLPPDRAWMGAQDYFSDLIIPAQFKGTDIEELIGILRQQIMWHQAGGPMDKEQYNEVKRTLNRLLITLDKQAGITDPDIGRYHD
ncbi:MAG TPA: hypothetical protein VN429_09965 [Methanospirillum sp.]|uniref:hypothetical protein n=1 Tax=Methanospirillum sp. TaxID=45200 RepID=UPI002C75794B|nr:hypothetical protein [Methanospirillum sp.]HWQ64728.1 hypothetical protein [Methanospirillum sp.]